VSRRHHGDVNHSGDAFEGEFQITTVLVGVNEGPVTLSIVPQVAGGGYTILWLWVQSIHQRFDEWLFHQGEYCILTTTLTESRLERRKEEIDDGIMSSLLATLAGLAYKAVMRVIVEINRLIVDGGVAAAANDIMWIERLLEE
jgi:hypothetical protein